MGLWTNLNDLAVTGSQALGKLIDRIATSLAGDPQERRRLAFSAAMVGLSAKMAKADGVVTRDEILAFGRLVSVTPEEWPQVRRLFDLARGDVAGYRSYAKKIASLHAPDDPVRQDIIDGLFYIATADGVVHPAELAFLADVARLLGLEDQAFERIKARHVLPESGDPYPVLGGHRSMSDAELHGLHRALVREHHPDRLLGDRLPVEFIALSTHRLAAINAAWDTIRKERGL